MYVSLDVGIVAIHQTRYHKVILKLWWGSWRFLLRPLQSARGNLFVWIIVKGKTPDVVSFALVFSIR